MKVAGGGLDLTFDDWPRFAVYLSGGWLEEYVYAQLKPYVEAGVIKDLRINLELALNSPGGGFPPYDSFTELDVVFTDGYSLYIVECKAGNVQQEQVMKLENLVRYYGGTDGRGVLATGFPPSREVSPPQGRGREHHALLGRHPGRAAEDLDGRYRCPFGGGRSVTLHLVCDTSGSMSENAKPFIVRTCVLTIAQYLRLGYASAEVALHRWADSLEEAAGWTVADEFPESFHRCERSRFGEGAGPSSCCPVTTGC